MTHVYAQTNIQLYAQLQEAGFEQTTLLAVHSSHRHAVRLFDGQYRASGKPFLNHVVGTASILATLSQSTEMLCAGLLHAAYTHGDFGLTALMGRGACRGKLRRAAGEEVEALVWDYTRTDWKVAALRRYCSTLSSASSRERRLLLLRLCNELEDHLDRGMQYSDKRRDVTAEVDRRELLLELAVGLGEAQLANALSTHITAQNAAEVPRELKSSRSGSFFARSQASRAVLHGARRFALRRL